MSTKTKGLLLALASYLAWAFLSIYWKALSAIPAYDVFAYRIFWTFITMLVYFAGTRQFRRVKVEVSQLFRKPSYFWRILVASVFIALNWLVYIYAVTNQQATEASLGYYINPLVSVLLALYILKERLNHIDIVAIILAGIGVCILVAVTGRLPLVTLILAVSFAVYGLLKKQVNLSSDVAMLIEAGMILPYALGYLLFFSQASWLSFSFQEQCLLALSGIITAIPLLLFAEAIKRAPLNQVGFVQYLNPTLQLLIAVFIFGETITSGELLGFSFIWLAVLVYLSYQFKLMRKDMTL